MSTIQINLCSKYVNEAGGGAKSSKSCQHSLWMAPNDTIRMRIWLTNQSMKQLQAKRKPLSTKIMISITKRIQSKRQGVFPYSVALASELFWKLVILRKNFEFRYRQEHCDSQFWGEIMKRNPDFLIFLE